MPSFEVGVVLVADNYTGNTLEVFVGGSCQRVTTTCTTIAELLNTKRLEFQIMPTMVGAGNGQPSTVQSLASKHLKKIPFIKI